MADNLEKDTKDLELALENMDKNSEWHAAAEDVLGEIAEKAASFRWLHNRCSVLYSNQDMKISITYNCFIEFNRGC